MNSLIFGLSLASAVSAQVVVNGWSTVAAQPSASAASYGDAAYAASSGGSYAPPAAYTSASSVYSSPPSAYTPPPSTDMSYSSFMSGGYKSMNCGYGYSKASDGSCQAESWVRIIQEPSEVQAYSRALTLFSTKRRAATRPLSSTSKFCSRTDARYLRCSFTSVAQEVMGVMATGVRAEEPPLSP